MEVVLSFMMTCIGIQEFLRYVEKLETDSTASASMKKQEGSYFDTFFNHTFSYDKRDQRYKTSDGYISRVHAKYSFNK